MEAQGWEPQGASWFAIGTGMHTAYERVLKKRPKRMSTAVRWAQKEVHKELDLIGDDALWSKSRPPSQIDSLVEHLMHYFWNEVIEGAPDWFTFQNMELEKNVQISPERDDWQWKGGASTTIDYVARKPHTSNTIIVDWKTGRSKKSDPMQLMFYRYLLELEGYKFSKRGGVWGAFFHAEYGEWQIVDEYDIDAIERMIGETQVLKQVPRPEPSPNWFCDYCVFKKVCPAWQEDDYDAEVGMHLLEDGVKLYSYITDPTKGN